MLLKCILVQFLVLLISFFTVSISYAQITVDVPCTGASSSGNPISGRITDDNSRSYGYLQWNNSVSTSTLRAAWISFNVGANIPSNATITGASVNFYVESKTYSSQLSNRIKVWATAPTSTSYNTMTSSNHGSFDNINVGWYSQAINATGVGVIQSNITSTRLSVSIYKTAYNGSYYAHGANGVGKDGTDVNKKPFLRITYTLPCTAPEAPKALANILLGPDPTVNGGSTLLPDANITANSCYAGCVGGGHEAWRGRLFNAGAGTQAWASWTNALDGSEYLQYDLGSIKPVSGIASQTRGDCCGQRVTSYTVQHSVDGSTWTAIPGSFTGNTDDVNVNTNLFTTTVSARYVRIYPTGFVNHMSMRVEIISIPCGGTNTVSISAEIPVNANTIRWYDAATGGNLLFTGQVYSPSISSTTTYYAEAYHSTTLCKSATRTAVTATVNYAPTLDGITVSSNCWFTDNNNTYTITAKATGCSPTSFDYSQYGMLALINYQGVNSPNYGGYFAWNSSLALLTASGHTLNQMACTGGGFVGQSAAYGQDKSTLISASTSVSGNQRTVNFVIKPDTDFPQVTNNSISQFVSTNNGYNSGWVENANLFTSTPPFTMGLLTVNGNTNTGGFIEVCPGQSILVSQSGFNNQGGSTYFYSDNTTGFGGWSVAPDWEIMSFGNITAANQVNGQTAVNDLSSFMYKINTIGDYVLHANSYYGSCYGAGSNRYIKVQTTTSPTVISPASTTICHGNSVELVASGGITSQNDVFVWQEGACNIAYEQNWNENIFGLNASTIGSINGILKITSTSADPMILMGGLGDFNPTIYRYINIRYRVLSGTAGNTEIFFYNTTHNYAVGGETGFGALISDGAWHILTIDMHQDPDYLTGGNIKGWRYDWCTASGVTMELDFISLDEKPIIQEGNTLNVSPTSTKTYYVSKRSNCGSTACMSKTVTLPTIGNNISGSNSATCSVKENNWVHFYDNNGLLIGAVNSGGVNLGNVTMQVNAGSSGTMSSCTEPTNALYRTAYMGRSWVVTSSAYPGTNFPSSVQVRLPFNGSELTAMNTVATSTTTGNPNDNGATVGNIMLTKFTGGTENFTPSDNCSGGVTRGVAQSGNGTVTSAYPSLTSATSASYVNFSVDQFSELFLHKNFTASPLPVKLIDFNASCTENTVHLIWTTSSEQNSQDFVVERSRDLNLWQEVEILPAAGNSSQNRDYFSTDAQAFNGTTYYRLRQRDLNGEEEIFGPIAATCGTSTNSIQVFPNPTQGSFTVQIHSENSESGVGIQLTNMTGQVIETRSINLEAGTNQVNFHNKLESGIYLIRVLDEKASFKTLKLEVRN